MCREVVFFFAVIIVTAPRIRASCTYIFNCVTVPRGEHSNKRNQSVPQHSCRVAY